MSESMISVPVKTSLFVDLVNFLREEGSGRDPVEVIQTAISYWIDNASWKQEDLMPEIYEKDKGYRWKEVFLPHGTSLRMKYKSNYYYAQVEGDDVTYNELKVSPSEFANKVAGSSRNAWRDLEICKKGEKEWKPAAEVRESARKAKEEIDRLMEGAHE